MNRSMFVRLATRVLWKLGDEAAANKAEAIAVEMDALNEILGEGPEPGRQPQQYEQGARLPQLQQQYGAPLSQHAAQPQSAAFPSPSPAAVTQVEPLAYDPSAASNLIQYATRIPDRVERVAGPSPMDVPPVRSLRPPAAAGKMKVEDLNLIIQERAPARLVFNVNMEDGTVRQMTFDRNVVSRHANDCVELMYYPPNTPQAAREATQVKAVMHIEDAASGAIDLPAVIRNLVEAAIISVQPRGQVMSVPPVAPPGPATSAFPKNPPANVTVVSENQTTFGVAAALASPMAPQDMPSQFHPGNQRL